MLDKINKFIKLISNDKIDIREAIKTLNKEDKVGGFMKLLKETEEKGIEKGIEKIAKKMLRNGSTIEQISLMTELSIERIKELEKELK